MKTKNRNSFLMIIGCASICLSLNSCGKSESNKTIEVEGVVMAVDKGVEKPLPDYEISVAQWKSKLTNTGIMGESGSPGDKTLSTTTTDKKGAFDFSNLEIKTGSRFDTRISLLELPKDGMYLKGYNTGYQGDTISPSYWDWFRPDVSEDLDHQNFTIRFNKAGYLKLIVNAPSYTASALDTTFITITPAPYDYKYPKLLVSVMGNKFNGNKPQIFNAGQNGLLATQNNVPLEIIHSKGGVRTYKYDSINITWNDTIKYSVNF